MRIRWLRTALAQLNELPNWIEEDYRAAGNDTVVPEAPHDPRNDQPIGRKPDVGSQQSRAHPGTREHSLFFGHYTLSYRMRGPVFEVLGVLPAAQVLNDYRASRYMGSLDHSAERTLGSCARRFSHCRGRGSKVVSDTTLLGEGRACRVFVDITQIHRARWLQARADFSDEELTFLATRSLAPDEPEQ